MSTEESREPTEASLQDLRRQVSDLQGALAAVGGGGVDAVVFGEVDDEQLYVTPGAGADRAYRVIVEHMGEGAATVSERGVILYANPRLATLFGVERDRMAGRDLSDFVPVDQLPTLTALLTTTTPEGTRDELTIPRTDGTLVPVLVTSTELDVDSVVVRCLVFTDLTMQKLVEQQIAVEAALAERQQVAHEVNDTIVQGLVAAEMALDLGQEELARSLVARTSSHARHWIGELVENKQLQPGSAVRSGPARGGTESP